MLTAAAAVMIRTILGLNRRNGGRFVTGTSFVGDLREKFAPRAQLWGLMRLRLIALLSERHEGPGKRRRQRYKDNAICQAREPGTYAGRVPRQVQRKCNRKFQEYFRNRYAGF